MIIVSRNINKNDVYFCKVFYYKRDLIEHRTKEVFGRNRINHWLKFKPKGLSKLRYDNITKIKISPVYKLSKKLIKIMI